MGNEGYECLGLEVGFPAETGDDEILERFADAQMIADMQKVFFGEGPNPLGHSYAKLIRGPAGRNDLLDVIELLHSKPWSKRAVITLCGHGEGKVPCINVVQFLFRDGIIHTLYFARGQDAFRKFYADVLCVASMARMVARGLQIPAGMVRGFIGSCHIYHHDLASIRLLVEQTKNEFVNLHSAGKPGDGPLTPALSPSERERENSPQHLCLQNGRQSASTNGDIRR